VLTEDEGKRKELFEEIVNTVAVIAETKTQRVEAQRVDFTAKDFAIKNLSESFNKIPLNPCWTY
jgi:hypothetical protein